MTQVVSIAHQGNIAVITIDSPPVNALSQAVRSGLVECVSTADADPDTEAMVLICAGRTFIAGADISEFGKPPLEPYLPDVLQILDNCSKPIIAALHGTALGGGLETALACRYRIALQNARVGLPEVNLGLIPGAGGTQRLPRIAGLDSALDMITSGRHVTAKEALQMGVIDEIADQKDLLEAALTFAGQVLAKNEIRQSIFCIPIRQLSRKPGNPGPLGSQRQQTGPWPTITIGRPGVCQQRGQLTIHRRPEKGA